MSQRRKILLAFSSWLESGLLREVIAQLDRSARVDSVADEHELVRYVSRPSMSWLPSIIILDNPPVRPGTASLIKTIREQRAWKLIPIAFFLPVNDIPTMTKWIVDKSIHYFPQWSRPSDCKFYLKQILHLCVDQI